MEYKIIVKEIVKITSNVLPDKYQIIENKISIKFYFIHIIKISDDRVIYYIFQLFGREKTYNLTLVFSFDGFV
jgi:hypothetical protein